MSEKLKQAREYELANSERIKGELPRFHVTAGIGWINDPNGLAPYKGEYHLFTQYHPYDIKWGPMHWGHLKTQDFMHWDRLPVAMAPDEEYDSFGCFSGSSIELPDGRHLLMYTGCRKEPDETGREVSFQTQCIAFGDGVNYEKYEHNPVIRGEQVAEGGSIHDFRDPQIWREDGKFYCAVGNRASDGGGTVLLYCSEDAINWEFVSKIDSSENRLGKMWECPNFFPVDGKYVLLVSPMDIEEDGYEFVPGAANVFGIVGDFDKDTHHLKRDLVQAIDYGLDFYAPQTMETYDGRRVMIGWMQNWGTIDVHMPGQEFMGQMTIARELTIRDGRLCQNPVREVEACRADKVEYKDVLVNGACELPGVEGRFVDLTMHIRPAGDDAGFERFVIKFAGDGEQAASVTFSPARSLVCMERSEIALSDKVMNARNFLVRRDGGEVKLRLILDRYSAELFVNDGEQAATMVFYTPLENSQISFLCDGEALVDVTKYDLVL